MAKDKVEEKIIKTTTKEHAALVLANPEQFGFKHELAEQIKNMQDQQKELFTKFLALGTQYSNSKGDNNDTHFLKEQFKKIFEITHDKHSVKSFVKNPDNPKYASHNLDPDVVSTIKNLDKDNKKLLVEFICANDDTFQISTRDFFENIGEGIKNIFIGTAKALEPIVHKIFWKAFKYGVEYGAEFLKKADDVLPFEKAIDSLIDAGKKALIDIADKNLVDETPKAGDSLTNNSTNDAGHHDVPVIGDHHIESAGH